MSDKNDENGKNMVPGKHNLYPAGSYVFDAYEGQVFEDGKVYYPAHITLQLDKREALDVIETLSRQVGWALSNPSVSIAVRFSGQIRRSE